jgi:anti-sigma regulatory factor (Ser/Thr protein kinase)
MTLELQATPQEVMRAVETFQDFGRKHKLDERVIFGLALALEECGSNIVDHGYKRDPSQKLQVILDHTGNTVTIELRDRGPEFDPTRRLIDNTRTDDPERPPGGWGISLVRHYADEIHYRREAGQNVLRLTKNLPARPASS